jgi:hypothetical protein
LGVTVRIYDHAGVRPAWMARARATARHVFNETGVGLIWIECAPRQDAKVACARPTGPADVFVMIVPRPSPEQARLSRMLGLAVLPERGRGTHLYVFHDRVKTLAAEYRRVDGAAILGLVIAHEVGHLLLGTNSHSTIGIMSAEWFGHELRRLAKGDLLYTSTEPMRIRNELTARMRGRDAQAGPSHVTVLPTEPAMPCP